MIKRELKKQQQKLQLKKELRDRINHVDTLLGNRTIAFLIVNGFLMSAAGTENIGLGKIGIALLGLLLTAIWFFIGFQTRRSITRLHLKFAQEFPDDEVNKVAFSGLFWRHKGVGEWIGPTELLAVWLPSVVFVAWALILCLK
jgi:hypothetical protein